MIVKTREVRRRRVLVQPSSLEFPCIIVLLVIFRSLYRCVGTTEAVWVWFRVTREFRRHGVGMLVKMLSPTVSRFNFNHIASWPTVDPLADTFSHKKSKDTVATLLICLHKPSHDLVESSLRT